jgi:hypothetical protein
MGRAPSQTLAKSHYLCQLCIGPIRPGRATVQSFGQTLTKLRSRLRNEAMVMLAELKLHMRDKYKQNDAAKARLKRHSLSPRPKARRPLQLLMQALSKPPHLLRNSSRAQAQDLISKTTL